MVRSLDCANVAQHALDDGGFEVPMESGFFDFANTAGADKLSPVPELFRMAFWDGHALVDLAGKSLGVKEGEGHVGP